MNQSIASQIQFTHPIFDEIETNCRTYKKQEWDDELIVVTFDLHFGGRGCGYAFPCDSAGNVFEEELSPKAHENYKSACIHAELGHWVRIECRPYIKRFRLCECGSGLEPEWQYDARGIELCRACPKCRSRKLRGYRQDVLTNSNYDCDEQVEADY